MNIKRYLSAAVSITMLAAVAMTSCGGSDNGGGSTGGSTGGETGAKTESKSDGGSTESKAEEKKDTSKPAGGAAAVTVWMPEELVDFTQTKLDAWTGTTEWAGKYTVTVSAMGEGDAATELLTDVEAGADVYGFAQDQLARLVSAGALSAPGGVFLDHVNANNDTGSISAASLDNKVYAYPETSDNGYFLYYDKSVVTDPSTLEGVLDQCGAAGKQFYMDLQSGWYNVAFFFATGAQCEYQFGTDGAITGANCDYSGSNGLTAMKAMINLSSNKAFSQSTGSDASLFDPNGGTAGAIVSGTWDSSTVSELLGANYGACKLPTFTVDGQTYQMSGFGGFKLVGVKPQTDSDKLTFCHAIADYLTGEEMQLERFKAKGWGPSNKNAQQADEVKSDIALAAIADQLQYCKPQGQYPNAYWDLSAAFGTDINSGKYKDASDADLTAALKEYEDAIKAAK